MHSYFIKFGDEWNRIRLPAGFHVDDRKFQIIFGLRQRPLVKINSAGVHKIFHYTRSSFRYVDQNEILVNKIPKRFVCIGNGNLFPCVHTEILLNQTEIKLY